MRFSRSMSDERATAGLDPIGAEGFVLISSTKQTWAEAVEATESRKQPKIRTVVWRMGESVKREKVIPPSRLLLIRNRGFLTDMKSA
ncbi:MAG: hypothetical protein ACJAYX_003958 [Planctomycetota bacterium]|jgi:hypothetical protein